MGDRKIIPIYPELPREILDAKDNHKLAIFVGAGFSRLCGCKGWDCLAEELLVNCFNNGFITEEELNKLKQESDNKKKISIAFDMFEGNSKESEFYELMKKNLTPADMEYAHNLYKLLYSLADCFITTNADELFDFMFPDDDIIFDFTNGIPIIPEKRKLYHIHGSIREPKSLVFTSNQYITRYHNSEFKVFINAIFHKYTILFIGYGLNEFELLDFMRSNVDTEGKINENASHFYLSGFDPYDDKIINYYKHYYTSLNVNLIPYTYLPSEEKYKHQIEILDTW